MTKPTREWAAEVTVDEALARRLIGGQFPQLADAPMRLLAEGWDNAVWLVDDAWAFRIPRRAVAIPGIERELRVLPRLAPMLPLPIPVPTHVGRPVDGYPWPFFGAQLLPGRELAEAALTDADRMALARPLAAFLRALHAPAVLEAVGDDLPQDPNHRADMAFRVPRTRERLEEGERLGLWTVAPSVHVALNDAIDLAPAGPDAVVHGDLHARHLLVDARNRPAGVIDWGDVCRADPSLDLSVAWAVFPRVGRAAFLHAYGAVPAERWLRARVLGLFLCATLAVYARDEGMRTLERESVAGVERASAD